MEAELLGPSLEQSFNQTMLSSLDQFSRGMADIVLVWCECKRCFMEVKLSTIATEVIGRNYPLYVGQAAGRL